MYMNTDLISVSNMSKRITNIKYSIITHVHVLLPQIQYHHYLKDQLLPYSSTVLIYTLSICNLKTKKHWNKMYMYYMYYQNNIHVCTNINKFHYENYEKRLTNVILFRKLHMQSIRQPSMLQIRRIQ